MVEISRYAVDWYTFPDREKMPHKVLVKLYTICNIFAVSVLRQYDITLQTGYHRTKCGSKCELSILPTECCVGHVNFSYAAYEKKTVVTKCILCTYSLFKVLTNLAQWNSPIFPGFPDPLNSRFHKVKTYHLSSRFGTFLAELQNIFLRSTVTDTTVAVHNYMSACCVFQIVALKCHLIYKISLSIF